jgi:hypothetical protein
MPRRSPGFENTSWFSGFRHPMRHAPLAPVLVRRMISPLPIQVGVATGVLVDQRAKVRPPMGLLRLPDLEGEMLPNRRGSLGALDY